MEEHRREPRYVFIHKIEISFEHETLVGEIMDWSWHGVQVCAHLELDPKVSYAIRFHVEHTSRQPENANQNYEIWTREGEIRWIRQSGTLSWFGILFYQSLEESRPHERHNFAIDHLGEYIHPEDTCSLAIWAY